MLGSRLLFAVLATFALFAALTEANPIARSKKKFTTGGKTKTPVSASATFCQSFRSACVKTALATKDTGKLVIKEGCQRNGGKYSTSYSFHCSADGKDITSRVLQSIGNGYSVTTTQDQVVVVTGTSIVATVSDFVTTTQEVDVTTSTTTSSYTTTTTTNVVPQTSVISTTLTTVLPFTYTSVYSTQTITSVIPTTSTGTSTITSYSIGTAPLGLANVVIAPVSNGKRVNQVDNSSFCSAFTSGCSSVCASKGSTPKHEICHAKTQNNYSLACVCANGKKETQHALRAALNQVHYTTVSPVVTSTTYISATSTQYIPTTVYSTSTATVTSVVPVTSTSVSLSTLTTVTTQTGYTGSSIPVTTASSVSTTTTSTTTTVSLSTTTTLAVALPTGVVHAIDGSTGQDYGGLSADSSSDFLTPSTNGRAVSSPIVWMAVIDPISGLYSLQDVDGSGNSFISESGHSGDDFEPGSTVYAIPELAPASDCGTAGVAAGPPEGSGPFFRAACEVYVFQFQQISDTLFNLVGQWQNPTGSATTTDTTQWFYDTGDQSEIVQLADSAASLAEHTGDSGPLVYLQFPYAS